MLSISFRCGKQKSPCPSSGHGLARVPVLGDRRLRCFGKTAYHALVSRMTKRTILFRRQNYQYQNQNNVQAQNAVQSVHRHHCAFPPPRKAALRRPPRQGDFACLESLLYMSGAQSATKKLDSFRFPDKSTNTRKFSQSFSSKMTEIFPGCGIRPHSFFADNARRKTGGRRWSDMKIRGKWRCRSPRRCRPWPFPAG